jgi:DMSO/TMAO reductase YedYZ heme-binding membrane subunit
VLLLVLSNDRSLRLLGVRRWKHLQRAVYPAGSSSWCTASCIRLWRGAIGYSSVLLRRSWA